MTQQVTKIHTLKPATGATGHKADALEAGLAVYVHWPWCRKKCPYCDFNSHVSGQIPENDYIQAVVDEIKTTALQLAPFAADTGKSPVVSVFFGGGTPSLMMPGSVAKVLEAVDRAWGLDRHTEVTLEANPTSSEAQKFKDFAGAGVNRISIGVQSLEQQDLGFLGREHNAPQALAAVDMALEATGNVNLDLIYGLPDQSLAAWEQQLKTAIIVGTTHISAYQLTIEPGTAFWGQAKRGAFTMPDDDIQADFYAATNTLLGQAAFGQYEVSNYARAGFECRHNRHVWRYGDYAGFGAGAHGRVRLAAAGRVATRNLKMPDAYMEAMGLNSNPRFEEHPLPSATQATEALLAGLRLSEGLPLLRLEALAHQPWQQVLDGKGLGLMTKTGFVTLDNTHPENPILKASPHGLALLDSVLSHLLPAEDKAA